MDTLCNVVWLVIQCITAHVAFITRGLRPIKHVHHDGAKRDFEDTRPEDLI